MVIKRHKRKKFSSQQNALKVSRLTPKMRNFGFCCNIDQQPRDSPRFTFLPQDVLSLMASNPLSLNPGHPGPVPVRDWAVKGEAE